MSAFGYTSRDYSTVRADMLRRAARVAPEWTDRDSSDFGMLMVDLLAFASDSMHYYIDRAAGESFLETAKTRDSVLAFARLFNYSPTTRNSARGSLVVQNESEEDLNIPLYTTFVAKLESGTTFAYATEELVVAPSGETATVSVAQGEPVLNEILSPTSDGSPSQRYPLDVEGAVASSIRVFVFEDGINPVEYLRVSRPSLARAGDRTFYIDIDPDGIVNVVFGDYVNGFIPPTGSRITTNYVISEGSRGNLPENSVLGFRESVDAQVTIVSSSALVGGIDDESISSMKANIPPSVAAQARAVTRSDFVSLALSVPDVAKAAVSYEPALVTGASATAGSVSIYAQPFRPDFVSTTETSQSVSADIRNDVIEFIQPLAMLGVTVVAEETVEWTPIDVTVTVYVNERAVTRYVEDDVRTVVESLFEFDSVEFGQRRTLSTVYRSCVDVAGVDYVVVDKFCIAGDNSVENSILVDPLRLPKLGTLTVNTVGGIETATLFGA